jgi:hypothetical protein
MKFQGDPNQVILFCSGAETTKSLRQLRDDPVTAAFFLPALQPWVVF